MIEKKTKSKSLKDCFGKRMMPVWMSRRTVSDQKEGRRNPLDKELIFLRFTIYIIEIQQ